MRRHYLTLIMFLGMYVHTYAQCPGAACPTPPAGLTGQALRTWLKQNYFDGKHSSVGYSEARRQMYNFIDNNSASAPNNANYGDATTHNKLFCVYSGYSMTWSYGGTDNTPDPINCEHTVPQSFFNSASIPKADIHHLFPTVAEWNSTRSNYPFSDIVDTNTDKWMKDLGSQTTIPTTDIDKYSEYENDGTRTFEPREDHKGNAARAIFYFYTMYPTIAGDISRVANPATLYAWHLADPVDNRERERNNRIFTVQGNRNPYIDHPSLVADAWGFSNPTPTNPTVNFATSGATVQEGNSGSVPHVVTINVSPSLSGAAVGSVRVTIDAAGTTAILGTDFTFTPTILNFNSTTSSATVTINVIGNTTTFGDKTVKLKLENITGLDAGNTTSYLLSINEDEKIITPIANIKTVDANGVLTQINEEFIIRGVTHGVNTNNKFANNGLQFAVIDNTGGVIIFYCSGSADCSPITDINGNPYVYVEGEEVEVEGQLKQFNGLAQISPTYITKLSTSTIKQPVLTNTVGEAQESEWIKMENLTYVSGWTGSGNRDINNAQFTSPSGATIVVRVDKETDVDNNVTNPTVGQKYTITGLGGQFDTSNPYTGNYQLQPQRATDVILTTTPPQVQLAVSAATIQEELSGTKTYTIDVIANQQIAGGFSVPFIIGGTATSADFTVSTASPLVFSATETQKTITITIIGDAILENPNETITITLQTPTGATPPALGANVVHTLTILDAGTIPSIDVQFSTLTGEVQEDIANSVTYEVSVLATSSSSFAFSVPFSVDASSTATAADYTIVTPSPLTFAPGEVIKVITITVNGDVILENPNEIIKLSLGTPTGSFPPNLGANSNHTLTILDAPVPVPVGLSFQSTNISVREGEQAKIILETPATSTNSYVVLGVTKGANLTDADFTSKPLVVNDRLSLQVPANTTSIEITFEALQDTQEESDENLTFSILSVGTGLSIGANTSASVTIQNGEPLAFSGNASEQIKVYPNPAKEVVYVNSSFENYTLQLRNSCGQLLKTCLVDKNAALSIKEVPEGLYFLEFVTKQGTFAKKIVIAR